MIASGILILLGLSWFGLHYWTNKPIDQPDGEARITGNCGDTMEISFKFAGGKIDEVNHWSDGCAISQQCIASAALLTHGKTLEQLLEISMLDILNMVGHLPDTHLHCAQLAETTLHQAAKNYSANLDKHDSEFARVAS